MGQSNGSAPSATDLARLKKLDYDAASRYVGVSVRTLERAKTSGAIGFVQIGRRVFFTRKQLDAYRAEYLAPQAVYVQPTLPGMESYSADPNDATFTEAQAAGVARALDNARARRARRALEGDSVA